MRADSGAACCGFCWNLIRPVSGSVADVTDERRALASSQSRFGGNAVRPRLNPTRTVAPTNRSVVLSSSLRDHRNDDRARMSNADKQPQHQSREQFPIETRKQSSISRRSVLLGGLAAISVSFLNNNSTNNNASAAEEKEEARQVQAAAGSSSGAFKEVPFEERKLVTTASGLRYTDFRLGMGAVPAWGDLLAIRYVTYTLDPKSNGRGLVKHDSSYARKTNYTMHHGNGFQMQGLEETVHTMRVGGVRRVIIPPHMAYVSSDVGPLPEWTYARRKLNKALQESGEFVVMDVELVGVKPIPDTHGYYSDLAPTTPEELSKVILDAMNRRQPDNDLSTSPTK